MIKSHTAVVAPSYGFCFYEDYEMREREGGTERNIERERKMKILLGYDCTAY